MEGMCSPSQSELTRNAGPADLKLCETFTGTASVMRLSHATGRSQTFPSQRLDLPYVQQYNLRSLQVDSLKIGSKMRGTRSQRSQTPWKSCHVLHLALKGEGKRGSFQSFYIYQSLLSSFNGRIYYQGIGRASAFDNVRNSAVNPHQR